MQLSKNFTLEEMCASATARQRGIKNEPDINSIINLTHLVCHILQPLRDAMGESIKIGSGYRSALLNVAVGGVKNSQHKTGEAADLCIDGDLVKGKKWFNWIKNHCEFDQLIWEHNSKGNYWVHVSYKHLGGNRKLVIDNLLKK